MIEIRSKINRITANITLKKLFKISKWTFQSLTGFQLIYCVISLIYSFVHPEEEKIIRSFNILFLIIQLIAIHYLYTKTVIIMFGLSVIGLLVHSVLNETLAFLFITMIYIISGSEFIIVTTLYKERRLQELLDQRYSAATIY